MSDAESGSRLYRWIGLSGLAVRRAVTRAWKTETQQTLLTISGIAVSIGLMLLVSSIGVGLAQSATMQNSDVDYTIAPAGGASSSVMDVEGTQLGDVHEVSRSLSERDSVQYAVPVRSELLQVNASTNDRSRMVVLGTIPSKSFPSVVGLSISSLKPGDPHYANGTYNGSWTGEVVLSESAATNLNASTGDTITIHGKGEATYAFTVVEVAVAQRAGIGQFPVGVVHLSELQSMTGGSGLDAADQILVGTDDDIETELAGVYPRSTVYSRGSLFESGGQDSELPLALSLASFIVAVVVGTLFMMTTMGFELSSESQERAVMAAIGISQRSRAYLLIMEALGIAILGGLIGVLLWGASLLVTNWAATTFLTAVPIAVFRPIFVVYGVGVAALIGLLTLPYLLVLNWRSITTDSLPR